MVTKRKNNTTKRPFSKGDSKGFIEARKISASTRYETCTEQLSPFGGALALIKFFDVIKFEEIIEHAYHKPRRRPKLGDYLMVVGILMLIFIGFNRLGHFVYIRTDAMLCGFFRVVCLPVVSTFWRYVNSLGINQAHSLLKVMGIVRERVWQESRLCYQRIHLDIDTTVATLYGNQQGGRRGHNTRHRGKKAYRPILGFIEESREYLTGKLRKGETVSGKECAAFIKTIKDGLPGCVEEVVVRADGEFLSGESISSLIEEGYDFIIGNKQCEPDFDKEKWYRPERGKAVEYNSCRYKPTGWKVACRFVGMRMLKEEYKDRCAPKQLPLFEDDLYTYRIFCTSLQGKADKVIAEYDKRADVENLIGEAKREGLDAIPSARFKNNYAWFQLVMLAYNIWRYMKILAQRSIQEAPADRSDTAHGALKGILDNTIRIARLKLLFIAAKVSLHDHKTKVRYSIHDARTPAMLSFLKFLDKARTKVRSWMEGSLWHCRFALNTR